MEYKEQIQINADQIAEENHGCDFHELSDVLRDEIYLQAIEKWKDDEANVTNMAFEMMRWERNWHKRKF